MVQLLRPRARLSVSKTVQKEQQELKHSLDHTRTLINQAYGGFNSIFCVVLRSWGIFHDSAFPIPRTSAGRHNPPCSSSPPFWRSAPHFSAYRLLISFSVFSLQNSLSLLYRTWRQPDQCTGTRHFGCPRFWVAADASMAASGPCNTLTFSPFQRFKFKNNIVLYGYLW